MKKLHLRQPVTITGLDALGRSAWLTLAPSYESGWHWKPYPNHNSLIPIDWRITRYHKWFRYLYLQHEAVKLRVIEHVLPLRLTGLTDVIVSGSSWPPYTGRCWELWDVVRLKLQETEEDIPRVSTGKIETWCYHGIARVGHVAVGPPVSGRDLSLRFKVEINYKGLGEITFEPVFNGGMSGLLEEVFKARAQGWPPLRHYILSRFLELFGSPLRKSVCWAHELSADETLQQFVRHRTQDFVGGLVLADHTALPAGFFTSSRAGHLADLSLLQAAVFQPVHSAHEVFA